MVAGAAFCKQCGSRLAGFRAAAHRSGPHYHAATAAALSIIPGLGQVYRGKPFRGMLWFFGVLIAYGFGAPMGLLIQAICAANAAFSGAIGDDAVTGTD